jgi:hypothetical protein
MKGLFGYCFMVVMALRLLLFDSVVDILLAVVAPAGGLVAHGL